MRTPRAARRSTFFEEEIFRITFLSAYPLSLRVPFFPLGTAVAPIFWADKILKRARSVRPLFCGESGLLTIWGFLVSCAGVLGCLASYVRPVARARRVGPERFKQRRGIFRPLDPPSQPRLVTGEGPKIDLTPILIKRKQNY